MCVGGGGGKRGVQGRQIGGNCGAEVGASISKPIPFIYLAFEKTDPFIYTEPKKKLLRDFNGTVSTYVYINSFYSYLLLHNNLKSIHQSSFTV